MVVKALDVVKRCDTASDGWQVNRVLTEKLASGSKVELSFEGVFDVPSSFINTSIVALLSDFSEDFIKKNLHITNATRQISDMIRRCLANGLNSRKITK